MHIIIFFQLLFYNRYQQGYFRMGKNPKLTAQQLREKRKQKQIQKKEKRTEDQKKRQEIKKNLQLRNENQQTEAVQTIDALQQSQNMLTGKYYDHFKDVFEKHLRRAKKYFPEVEQDQEKSSDQQPKKDQENKQPKQSRKQKKMMRWLKVAQLKSMVKRPDLVEAWDITAPDPLFLCQMKTLKNTVPVPRHWNQKSKFLQTKRGILKPMFKLPQFIQATGISKLRDPFSQRDGQKMVREKLKQRMNPKLGKIDIDYAVLHDAFFKYQLKSDLSVFGDIYYEGKQDQAKAKQFKPGLMSESLRMALGISDYQAPPWIINMQRYGGPPNYPTLRILGSSVPFSQLTTYSVINKSSLEQTAKKLGQPGLYATFKSYYEQEEQDYVDKGYWGQVAAMEQIPDEEGVQGWEQSEQFNYE